MFKEFKCNAFPSSAYRVFHVTKQNTFKRFLLPSKKCCKSRVRRRPPSPSRPWPISHVWRSADDSTLPWQKIFFASAPGSPEEELVVRAATAQWRWPFSGAIAPRCPDDNSSSGQLMSGSNERPRRLNIARRCGDVDGYASRIPKRVYGRQGWRIVTFHPGNVFFFF